MVVLAACGRIDFATVGDGGAVASGTITHVQAFVQLQGSSGAASHTFTAQATAVGDLVLVHEYCRVTPLATGVMIAAPGWSFVQLGATANAAGENAASFAAIAPDTASATFTVTWATTGCIDTDDIGDEFGGSFVPATAIDSHDEETGDNDCVAHVTTRHSGDAVWAACTTLAVSGLGTGYTLGADDGHGD